MIMIVSTAIRSGSDLKLFGVGWQKECVYLGLLSSRIVLKLAAACLVDLAGWDSDASDRPRVPLSPQH
jgi:hypothetical protein